MAQEDCVENLFEPWSIENHRWCYTAFRCSFGQSTFIIYPSMYCSKYRPYRAVEYKPANCIFRITI